MLGLKNEERKGFLNFFNIVQKEAAELGAVYFLRRKIVDCYKKIGDCECFRLEGWLVPNDFVDEFSALYENSSVGKDWDIAFKYVEWYPKDNRAAVWFRDFYLGLRTIESDEFLNFFKIVQDEAGKFHHRFFLKEKTGQHQETLTCLECDSLNGWLIPEDKVSEFNPLFRNLNVGNEWDEFLHLAEWKNKFGVPSIWFSGMLLGLTKDEFDEEKTMMGLRTYESENFLNFFKIIQEEAEKEESVFFLDEKLEGHSENFGKYECCNLTGWVIYKPRIHNFSDQYFNDNVEPKFESYRRTVEWKKVNGVPVVKLNWKRRFI